MTPKIICRRLTSIALLSLMSSVATAQDEPLIIQPGSPGEPSREITAAEASDLAGLLHTEADVKFMQGMIMHHAQALDMTALIEGRSATPDLATLGDRIERTQADEIRMMQEWLAKNGYEATSEHSHHAHDAEMMPGMLTPEEMASLEAASKVEFDRLFLELMISHHQGALIMVDELLENGGAAQEPTIFRFTADIVADQGAEIGRMAAMLESLTPDPRVGLAPGYLDAEEAAWNLDLVASVPRPAGFFSPMSPAGIPVPEEDEEEGEEEAEAETEGDEEMTEEEKEEAERLEEAEALRESMIEEAKERARMTALFSFANTDLAFAGDRVVVGNYHGFNSYDISDPVSPQLIASVVCPGGQGDPSIVGDLMILSVEENRGRLDCGLQGVADKVSTERFRGIRIFDISDLARPRQVAAVQTCRGSHTHTVVTDPDDDGNFYVYVSGTAGVREEDELEGCSDEHPGDDENSALFSIDVVQVPVENPENARVVGRPRIFADPETGRIAGLWKGGDHGRGTQRTWRTDQCHDITVFPELGLAAGACSGNGILLDVSDPANPVRLDAVVDSGFAYWHSATFNNDGTKVLFTDEWGGGMRPRCQASDPKTWGADAIYDIVDGKLEFRGYYKLPAPQTDSENCVAHNGSLVPVPGRDIMVQAWYQGGISIFDFTDSANPVEIAFFDRGPLDPEEVLLGGPWSTYWHNGMIYSSEIARGLDVLRLVPSEHLTQNEIDAAATIDSGIVNAQYQRKFVWPVEPVVALAHVDQLERSGALEADQVAALRSALAVADQAVSGKRSDPTSAMQLSELSTALEESAGTSTKQDDARRASLVEVLKKLAEQLG
jgi:uncharacterized protein (DUF305 family)